MYEIRLIDMTEAYPLFGYMWIATVTLAFIVGKFIKDEYRHIKSLNKEVGDIYDGTSRT